MAISEQAFAAVHPPALLLWHFGAHSLRSLPLVAMASAGAGNSPRTAPGGGSPRVERDASGMWVVVGSFPKETYYVELSDKEGSYENGMPRRGWLSLKDQSLTRQWVKLTSTGDVVVSELKRMKIEEAAGVIHKAGSGSRWAGLED